MIIHNNKIIKKAMESIANSKDCSYYQMLPTGELYINNYFTSYVFLAYVRGNWFASHGMRKGSSMAVTEQGLELFACSNNSIWLPINNKEADIASLGIPLDEETRVVLFAFSGKSYDVIIADGSKYPTVIKTNIKKTVENTSFLILTLTAMIRQYDSKAADEIMSFFFKKNAADDSEEDCSEPPATIDWKKEAKMTQNPKQPI